MGRVSGASNDPSQTFKQVGVSISLVCNQFFTNEAAASYLTDEFELNNMPVRGYRFVELNKKQLECPVGATALHN